MRRANCRLTTGVTAARARLLCACSFGAQVVAAAAAAVAAAAAEPRQTGTAEAESRAAQGWQLKQWRRRRGQLSTTRLFCALKIVCLCCSRLEQSASERVGTEQTENGKRIAQNSVLLAAVPSLFAELRHRRHALCSHTHRRT